jgi:hypothetical protein
MNYSLNVKLSYITYYNKYENNLLSLIYFLNKYKNVYYLNNNLPKKNKYFTLLKSPKCYKTGKLLLKYSYYRFFLLLSKKIKSIKLKNCLNYFNKFKQIQLKYQSSLIKINKITLLIYIDYTLSSFCVFFYIILLTSL